MEPREHAYALGHDPAELQRLNLQGRVLGGATRTILGTAGLRRGMRVLDLGSGIGDVSFLVADLVGSTGEVVGLDASPDAVATATIRAQQRGLENVTFVVGDIHEAVRGEPFDAIVERLVLMYVPDPAAVLRTQSAVLRPGGLVVAIELDTRTAGSWPSTPLVDQALGWVGEAFERSAIAPALGRDLWSIVARADLRPLASTGIQPHFGPDDRDGAAMLAGIVGAMLPAIERTGVASAADVAIETLEDRLADEIAYRQAVFAHPILLGTWAVR